MRVAKSDRPSNECPECGMVVETLSATLFQCVDINEAVRISAFVCRPVFVQIGKGSIPRLLRPDGSYFVRADIVADKLGGDFWYTGNGLRLHAISLSWMRSTGE